MDEGQFKAGMRRLAGSICVVACRDGAGRIGGLAASSVTALSARPPSLLVCVNSAALAHDALMAASRFSVNVLAPGDAPLAQRIASRDTRAEALSGPRWSTDPAQPPVLAGATVSFLCARVDPVPRHGTHSILIGDIFDIRLSSWQGDALVQLDGRMGAFGHPVATQGADR